MKYHRDALALMVSVIVTFGANSCFAETTFVPASVINTGETAAWQFDWLDDNHLIATTGLTKSGLPPEPLLNSGVVIFNLKTQKTTRVMDHAALQCVNRTSQIASIQTSNGKRSIASLAPASDQFLYQWRASTESLFAVSEEERKNWNLQLCRKTNPQHLSASATSQSPVHYLERPGDTLHSGIWNNELLENILFKSGEVEKITSLTPPYTFYDDEYLQFAKKYSISNGRFSLFPADSLKQEPIILMNLQGEIENKSIPNDIYKQINPGKSTEGRILPYKNGTLIQTEGKAISGGGIYTYDGSGLKKIWAISHEATGLSLIKVSPNGCKVAVALRSRITSAPAEIFIIEICTAK